MTTDLIETVFGLSREQPHPLDTPAVRARLAALIDGLDGTVYRGKTDPRWRTVLRLRFGLDGEEPQRYAEIAALLGLPRRDQVRQIEATALRLVRTAWSRQEGDDR